MTEVIHWDAWRQRQPMTFAEQQEFYERVAQLHPNQRSFDAEGCNRFFDEIVEYDLSVVELGGWDGALAEEMLKRDDISSWINYDLVAVPQTCTDPRYWLEVLDDFLWNKGPVEADVFVASHTIEHLTGGELRSLLDALRVQWVYLDAPLPETGVVDWTGYQGSHVLELNWEQVEELLRERGWQR